MLYGEDSSLSLLRTQSSMETAAMVKQGPVSTFGCMRASGCKFSYCSLTGRRGAHTHWAVHRLRIYARLDQDDLNLTAVKDVCVRTTPGLTHCYRSRFYFPNLF